MHALMFSRDPNYILRFSWEGSSTSPNSYTYWNRRWKHTHTHKQTFMHSRSRRHTVLSLLPNSFDPGSLKDLLHQKPRFRNGRYLKRTRQNRMNQSINQSTSPTTTACLQYHERKAYSILYLFSMSNTQRTFSETPNIQR